MHAQVSNIRRIARFAGEVVAETLWPTRCALCDRLGEVLCDSCARNLPFADWWRACPRCGSPLGLAQCDLCNPVSLGRIGRDRLPFAHCASAVMFTQLTGQLVRVYKDQGERRLAGVMAGFAGYARIAGMFEGLCTGSRWQTRGESVHNPLNLPAIRFLSGSC